VKLVWDENAWDDYVWWQSQDRRLLRRINSLIQDIAPVFKAFCCAVGLHILLQRLGFFFLSYIVKARFDLTEDAIHLSMVGIFRKLGGQVNEIFLGKCSIVERFLFLSYSQDFVLVPITSTIL